MLTILDKLSPGAEVGEMLGSGLSGGLKRLVDSKLGQLQNQAGLSSMMSPEQAQALSMMPEGMLKTILPQIMKNQQYQQGLRQFSGSPGAGSPGAGSPGAGQPIQDLSSQVVPELQQQQPQQQVGPTGYESHAIADRMAAELMQSQQRTSQSMQQATQQPEAMQQQELPLSGEQLLANENQLALNAGKQAYALSHGNPAIALRAQQEESKRLQKERQGSEKASRSEKQFAFNFNKKYIEKADDAARNAIGDKQNLAMQRDLVKTGKLIGPRENAFLDLAANFLGLDESGKSAFKNSESQIFEKLSVPYFRSLKEKFGSRPTQWEAQQLQKSFPSLYQTNAGREVIINFMEHDADSAIKEKKFRRQIISENKGIPPLDLPSQTEDRLSVWKDKNYVDLRSRVSNILAEEHGPDPSTAKSAGAGAMVESDDGIVFQSNGKKWEMMFSDTKGE